MALQSVCEALKQPNLDWRNLRRPRLDGGPRLLPRAVQQPGFVTLVAFAAALPPFQLLSVASFLLFLVPSAALFASSALVPSCISQPPANVAHLSSVTTKRKGKRFMYLCSLCVPLFKLFSTDVSIPCAVAPLHDLGRFLLDHLAHQPLHVSKTTAGIKLSVISYLRRRNNAIMKAAPCPFGELEHLSAI